MKTFALLLFTLLCFASCQEPLPEKSGWKLVYKNGPSGKSIIGNKSELLDAVRLGYPIRIGWGSNRVEHVAEADFLTIFDGQEVFAQINSIVGQAPRIDGDTLKIRFREQNHWTKIAGTNGYSTGLMTDYINDSIVGGNTDRYTATTWYVLYPSNHNSMEKPSPLWKDGSPNWEKWNAENK